MVCIGYLLSLMSRVSNKYIPTGGSTRIKEKGTFFFSRQIMDMDSKDYYFSFSKYLLKYDLQGAIKYLINLGLIFNKT